jgi:hypothetical protein
MVNNTTIENEHPAMIEDDQSTLFGEETLDSTLEASESDEVNTESEMSEDLSELSVAPGEAVARSANQSSWIWYFLGLLLILWLANFFVSLAGDTLFWAQRASYISSVILRFIILLASGMWLIPRLFLADHSASYIVIGWAAVVSGIIVSIGRYISEQNFWTFLNLIIEPADSLLLALAAVWLTLRLKKILTQQKDDQSTHQA